MIDARGDETARLSVSCLQNSIQLFLVFLVGTAGHASHIFKIFECDASVDPVIDVVEFDFLWDGFCFKDRWGCVSILNAEEREAGIFSACRSGVDFTADEISIFCMRLADFSKNRFFRKFESCCCVFYGGADFRCGYIAVVGNRLSVGRHRQGDQAE